MAYITERKLINNRREKEPEVRVIKLEKEIEFLTTIVPIGTLNEIFLMIIDSLRDQ